MDMRVSGKDLIRNHLSFSLYQHEAMWGVDKMPKSFFCNGYLMLNGEKMSKSTGNFMTIDQCLEKYGADATRIALADAGDSLDDANFDEETANAAILKLFTLEQWIKDHLPPAGFDFATFDLATLGNWDKIVYNECKKVSKEAQQNYSRMRLKYVNVQFNEFISLKETYSIATEGKTNPAVIFKYIETLLTMMNPIIPHFCQTVWQSYVLPAVEKTQNFPYKPAQELFNNGWVRFENEDTDPVMSASLAYLQKSKKAIRTAYDKALTGGAKKKGGKKGAEPEAPKSFTNCAIFVGSEFPAF